MTKLISSAHEDHREGGAREFVFEHLHTCRQHGHRNLKAAVINASHGFAAVVGHEAIGDREDDVEHGANIYHGVVDLSRWS